MGYSIKRQKGAAAIILVFLLIPLFGFVFLALEGTRYIQKKNRLADAAEAAAFSITMANRGNKTSYEKKLATKYVKSYVRHIKDVPELSVSFSAGGNTVGTVRKPYFQYEVDVKTTYKSWFSSLLIPSFSPTESVVNKSIARNYPEFTGGKLIELVFVTDFSGSMNSDFNSTSTSKISVLRSSIKAISELVLKNDANRIGIVPFSDKTVSLKGNELFCQTRYMAGDYAQTIKKMTYRNSRVSVKCSSPFHSITLTNDIKKLSTINNMQADGRTASYEGIMKAAEMLCHYNQKSSEKGCAKNTQKMKVILILSDGVDNDTAALRNLITPPDGSVGMCQKIKNAFTKDGGEFSMAFIGIAFTATAQKSFKDCVGEDKVIDVKEIDSLTSEIKKMMNKATTKEGVSKLHYRYEN